MYIDNENFDKWMEKLSKKLTEIGQDLKSLINTDQVLEENERLLDNQDLAFLLKVSFRTLQLRSFSVNSVCISSLPKLPFPCLWKWS